MKWFRLKAPAGCDTANHSGFEPFIVRDGHIDAPECAVDGLTRVGGFVVISETPREIVVQAPSAEFIEEVEKAMHAAGEPVTATPEIVAQVVAAIEHRTPLRLTIPNT